MESSETSEKPNSTWNKLEDIFPETDHETCIGLSIQIHLLILQKECWLSEQISSNPFAPCGAQGIHKELTDIAVSIYLLDLVPWSSCVSYLILYCPTPRSVRSTSPSISLRIPV